MNSCLLCKAFLLGQICKLGFCLGTYDTSTKQLLILYILLAMGKILLVVFEL